MPKQKLSNKKSSRKLSDNKNFEFEVEPVQFLTPYTSSVEPSPTKQDSVSSSQRKTRSRKTESLKDEVAEFESQKKTKSTKKIKKNKTKKTALIDDNVGLSVKTSKGKENNLSVSNMLTRSTRSRSTLIEKAVQDSTISTFSETGELNDSCSFVTLRKIKESKKKNTTVNTLPELEVKSASKPSNKSTEGIKNLTFTPPSAQLQNNTHSNYLNIQNDDVFDLVSNTPTQELGKFMLDDGESVLLSDTLYKKMSVMPRLTRTGTFTVTEPVNTPKPQPIRKSVRKRWSQGEKTPIFDRNPLEKDLKKTSSRKLDLDSPKSSALLKVPQAMGEGHQSIFNSTHKSVSRKSNKSMNKEASCSKLVIDNLKQDVKPSFSTTPRSSECELNPLNSTKTERSVIRKALSSKMSTVKKTAVMEKTKKSSTNLDPSFSNTRRSSQSSVIILDSTDSEISAPSSKISTTRKTAAEMIPEDSVIIIDSTKSEKSMWDGAGFTHKSAMKSTVGKKQNKQKKSVKLTSPELTPRNKKLPPLAVRKTPLLKSVFNGDNSILASNRVGPKGFTAPSASSTPFRSENRDQSLKAKPSSRVKLPDFKKIHERQLEKMEDIKEYQERKAARAQLLISGSKSNTSKVPSFSDKEAKKKLVFSPAIQKTLPKPEQERAIKRASLERQIIEKKQKMLGSKVPKLVLSKPQQLLINKRYSSDKKNNSTLNKPEIRSIAGKNKLLKKNEEIKSVATKAKTGSNLSQRNRAHVVNVRTNRRFELLMKMREKEGKKS